MKRRLLVSGLAAATVLLAACNKDVIRGSGSIITESRNVAPFSKVEINGNKTAEIIPSTVYKVEVKGYENLVGMYREEIRNGELHFEYPNHTVTRNDNISLKIYTPEFATVRLIGNAQVNVQKGFTTNSFQADLSGNGKLNFDSSQANSFVIRSSGNGEVEARKFISSSADVETSGNAKIKVHTTQTLRVRVSGSSEVKYWGHPTDIDVSISGNGHVIPQ